MNINNFDLNLLLVYRALFEERNVTKASKKIGITQPAMSNALNRLRYLVKDELFIRGPRGMRPTPRAMELSIPIQVALSNIESSLETVNFNPKTSRKQFKLSMSDDVAPLILPNLVAYLQKNSPNSSLCVRSSQGNEAIKLLDVNEIDFAIGRFELVPSRFGVKTLFDERYVCLVSQKHFLATEKKLSMDQYLASKHLRVAPMDAGISPVDRALAQLNLERIISVRIDLITLSPFLISNTELILTIPSKTAARIAKTNKFIILELPLELEKRQTKLIWHKDLTKHESFDWIKNENIFY
tara:strand:+ start:38 stop:931 length:894 start_codon:yes stop_codon:yes gene_type:complete